MTDSSTVASTVAGEPCRVTSPLLRQEEARWYVCARDATLTAQANDGRQHHFAVKCASRAQADYVWAQMKQRLDLSHVHYQKGIGEPPPDTMRIIPFRLLPRRWLADWRETADRIEVREGASGSVYMTAVIAGETVAEKRVPSAHRCHVETEIARLRAQHPSLYLFDFRPQRGEGK